MQTAWWVWPVVTGVINIIVALAKAQGTPWGKVLAAFGTDVLAVVPKPAEKLVLPEDRDTKS